MALPRVASKASPRKVTCETSVSLSSGWSRRESSVSDGVAAFRQVGAELDVDGVTGFEEPGEIFAFVQPRRRIFDGVEQMQVLPFVRKLRGRFEREAFPRDL